MIYEGIEILSIYTDMLALELSLAFWLYIPRATSSGIKKKYVNPN
jgi:hypothetical protein